VISREFVMLACYSNTVCGPMIPDSTAKVAEYVLADPARQGCADQLPCARGHVDAVVLHNSDHK